jgi:hypothetical protein
MNDDPAATRTQIHTESFTPPAVFWPRVEKDGLVTEMRKPLEIASAMPRMIMLEASVAMNELTRRPATMKPLTAPHASPASRAPATPAPTP